MKVLLADGSPAFRTFIRQILEVAWDVNVAGQASDAEEVVRLAQQLKPDVVLMDIDLPGLDGLEATGASKPRCRGRRLSCCRPWMGRPAATPQRSTGLTASCRKAPRFPRSFLSSGTEARQRLHRKVVNFARRAGVLRQPSCIVRVAMRLFVQSHSPKGVETGAQRKLLPDSPYHHQSDREKQESNQGEAGKLNARNFKHSCLRLHPGLQL